MKMVGRWSPPSSTKGAAHGEEKRGQSTWCPRRHHKVEHRGQVEQHREEVDAAQREGGHLLANADEEQS